MEGIQHFIGVSNLDEFPFRVCISVPGCLWNCPFASFTTLMTIRE